MPAQQCTSIRADAGVYLVVPKPAGIYKSLRTWHVLPRVLLNSIAILQLQFQLSQPTRSSVLQYSPATQKYYTHWLTADCIAPPRHVSPRVTHFPSSTQRRSPLIGTWTCTCRISFSWSNRHPRCNDHLGYLLRLPGASGNPVQPQLRHWDHQGSFSKFTLEHATASIIDLRQSPAALH